MHKYLLLSSLIILSTNCFSQTFWRIENKRGEEILLTMKVNQESKTFEAHTRKDALKDIAGTFTFFAARTAGILKYPEIIHIEGEISEQPDATFYSGTFIHLDDSYQFKAETRQNSFTGKIVDNKNRTRLLHGEKISSDKPLRNYATLINKAFLITEKYYFDRNLIKLSEWQNFKEDVNDMKSDISDDYELAAVIYWYRKKLPFPRYEIEKTEIKENVTKRKKSFVPNEIEKQTILLRVSDIPDRVTDMKQLFNEIQNNQCTNLIIDLRGRKKLQLTSAVLLANHLTVHSVLWGAYLTQKWTNTNGSLPNPVEYETHLKNFARLPNKDKKFYLETGFYLKTEPANTVFKGKTFLLIDQRTSKVAEALAIALKNENIATLVGQKSAGLPMLTDLLPIDQFYHMSIQVAQFHDKEGKSYFTNGITPDLEVSDEDALSYLLKKIH